MFVWTVSNLCVSIIGDSFEVMNLDTGKVIAKDVVKGLAKHCAKGVGIKMGNLDGMHLINIIEKGSKWGSSYTINCEIPEFSEWGDCGLTIPKD